MVAVDSLGSSAGQTAAAGATLIPAVGPAAGAVIKVIDSMLPQTTFCDPRSAQELSMIALRSQPRFTLNMLSSQRDALNRANAESIRRIQSWEASCKGQLSSGSYSTPAYQTPVTTTPWYRNWKTYGVAAVGILGVGLAARIIRRR